MRLHALTLPRSCSASASAQAKTKVARQCVLAKYKGSRLMWPATGAAISQEIGRKRYKARVATAGACFATRGGPGLSVHFLVARRSLHASLTREFTDAPAHCLDELPAGVQYALAMSFVLLNCLCRRSSGAIMNCKTPSPNSWPITCRVDSSSNNTITFISSSTYPCT